MGPFQSDPWKWCLKTQTQAVQNLKHQNNLSIGACQCTDWTETLLPAHWLERDMQTNRIANCSRENSAFWSYSHTLLFEGWKSKHNYYGIWFSVESFRIRDNMKCTCRTAHSFKSLRPPRGQKLILYSKPYRRQTMPRIKSAHIQS